MRAPTRQSRLFCRLTAQAALTCTIFDDKSVRQKQNVTFAAIQLQSPYCVLTMQ
jgi:hypothetical protein